MSDAQPPVGSLLSFPDRDALASAACETLVELARTVVEEEGRPFRIALSGGSTPRQLYQMLADQPLPWGQIEWFWGDERNVPHEHADSNYRMVREALLNHAPVPAERVHAVPVDPADPAATARAYEETLARVFELEPGDPSELPEFDLVLLGMGDDAHTASLFPGTEALRATERWFVENWVEKFDAYRLTLTAPVINAATNVWFLITGENKREALAHVWQGRRDASAYPSQLIEPSNGLLRWMVSSEALPSGTTETSDAQ